MSFNIYHNLFIKASQEAVFNAVSIPEHLDNWWSLKSSGTPELGVEYNLNFTDEYNWFCKVSKLELNKLIAFKMTVSDKDWDPTTFQFELEPHNEGTMLKFSHVNWPEANDHFKYSSFCWAMLLSGLKNYLEKGLVIPFEERN
ncbi:SRPBCC family protein [Aestuariibaculum marinum]|uniref:SRPBCC domain-containing protein n=1 Tax=Aestuariibaculum marinum TaxID=2683592 RepID=A0A8J6PT29_9FLAO|nr:SRPBCC domain-containing protein [Aestuariibaculum marinum]MBD0823849.1 SRPBCC domain-containing protein [Aestuariibaculum marinum]